MAIAIDAILVTIVADHARAATPYPRNSRQGDALLDWVFSILSDIDLDSFESSADLAARPIYNFVRIDIADGKDVFIGPNKISFETLQGTYKKQTPMERRAGLKQLFDDVCRIDHLQTRAVTKPKPTSASHTTRRRPCGPAASAHPFALP